MSTFCFGQETTGSLQGTVKDPSGAVVPNAQVSVSTANLAGGKSTVSDAKGFYHFSSLPPGAYVVRVEAKGFEALKQEGLVIEVGHAPSLDLVLSIGSQATTVDVTSASPEIDVTSVTTQTNITQDVISYVPHGVSFQSVIQFAPSARQEPLQGSTALGNGSGGSSPGNASNGGTYGYSVAGGADSENSYLVEGQETADVIGGFSHTNVPFDFIHEEEVKTSGVQAEYRGSLGGVVNVIMEKGSNQFHGSVFLQFQNDAMSGSPTAYSRYDPNGTTSTAENGFTIDAPYQQYQPKKDKLNDILPGFTIGGPILKNHLFFFVGFNPELKDLERQVTENGVDVHFSQNQQTYYTTARLDASVTQKLHLFASWLYQGQREAGESLPLADDQFGLFNVTSTNPASNYAHNLGYVAPNITTNFGADYTISKNIVSTTRFGYFFENYHDYGYPTGGNTYEFAAPGDGEASGFTTQAVDSAFTHRNAEKHTQFDEDVSFFKSGWAGTHTFRVGYQLNKQSDDIFQGYNAPLIVVDPGLPYAFATTTGATNCAAIVAAGGTAQTDPDTGALIGCAGSPAGAGGYEYAEDAGNGGNATSYNHAIYAQDSWSLKGGLTLTGGIRIEKEYLPAENQPGGQIVKPINFGWGDKIQPRVGAAWDIMRNGKAKLFGEYGAFTDVMKLNLAISSFGGQYWDNCVYAMDAGASYTALSVTPNAAGRYCPSTGSGAPALLTGGTVPPGFTYIENQNFRQFPTTCSTCSPTAEGVAPGIKPYRQHEAAFGFDYQLRPTVSFEARYDRRRLDSAIEDSSLFNPNDGGETFVVVNPGLGVNSTFNNFWNFLYGAPPPACSGTGCPPNQTIPAARSYDGAEFRVTKEMSHHWFAMASYTFSHFRGNYTGLTSSDVGDGGGGRNAPNNGRSFDEPFFSYDSHGNSSSGDLPTDRRNVGKGYAYYELPWGGGSTSRNKTDFGIFQVLYGGSPVTSYLDVGYAFPGGFPTFVEGRGNWANVSQNPVTGNITTGPTYERRTNPYTQTDINLKHTVKLWGSQAISFDATITNALNQRAVTAYNAQIDSNFTPTFVEPQGESLPAGEAAYAAFEHPYDWRSLLTQNQVVINSQYGKPYLFQNARTIRVQFHYTF